MAQTLPESVTDYRINLVGFAGMLGAAYLVAFNEMPIPEAAVFLIAACLLYTSPSPRDKRQSRMPSSA